jgi:hypothetical protein
MTLLQDTVTSRAATLSFPQLALGPLTAENVRHAFANMVKQGGSVTWDAESVTPQKVTFYNLTITGTPHFVHQAAIYMDDLFFQINYK